jgi:isopentenyl-diphosphate delta-isomerase
MNRKDDHIQLALQQQHVRTSFDAMRLPYEALPTSKVDDVSLDVKLFNRSFPSPIFINAMTGGTLSAHRINERLAKLAEVFQLPMALGSSSIMLKDPTTVSSFSIVRDVNPNGFLIANLGAHHPLKNVRKVMDLLKADAFEYHLNLAQELAMPEGDRDFTSWKKNIQEVAQNLSIPFLVKEVGFGMNTTTMKTLQQLGVQTINVGGRGGTNFATIENKRRSQAYDGLNQVGYTTIESLLMAKKLNGIQVLASGGIQTPLDAIKALVLGAKMIGMSSYFLNLIHQYEHDESVQVFQSFLEEMKMIMMTMNVTTIDQLSHVHYRLASDSLWID